MGTWTPPLLRCINGVGITPPLCHCWCRTRRRAVINPWPNQGRAFFTCFFSHGRTTWLLVKMLIKSVNFFVGRSVYKSVQSKDILMWMVLMLSVLGIKFVCDRIWNLVGSLRTSKDLANCGLALKFVRISTLLVKISITISGSSLV